MNLNAHIDSRLQYDFYLEIVRKRKRFSKWTKEGEFKQIRESKCMTKDEYNAYLNSPDYLCKYYQKSIWKESERAYGKNNINILKKN